MSLVLRLSGKDESWGTYVCRTRRVRVEEKCWGLLISIDELKTRGHLSLYLVVGKQECLRGNPSLDHQLHLEDLGQSP